MIRKLITTCDNFSVDLDFNLLDPTKEKAVYEKVRKILLSYGKIFDEAMKFYGPIIVLDYGVGERKLKVEISKLMSTDPLRDTFERISRAMAVWEELLPILDEIDRQNQLAADELPRISAKLNTVPDKGYTIQDLESSILRLEKTEEICLQIISELKNGVQFYNELETGVDCSEELESLENNLKDVQQHHARCLELLTTKRVQLDFIAEADAEYHSRPKPKSAEEECDIFLPDYVPEFLEMEKTFVLHKYLDSAGHWITEKQLLIGVALLYCSKSVIFVVLLRRFRCYALF